MTDDETGSPTPAVPAEEARIPFKQFLESVHPSIARSVSGLWSVRRSSGGTRYIQMNSPDLRLHCQTCEGKRTFRCASAPTLHSELGSVNGEFISYRCGDCHKRMKSFSLWVKTDETEGVAVAYKYGEKPPFGVPVPNKLLSLFGEERANFLKGRQCENQGLGVGAFAYYRRVVENHKNEIFDAIVAVCETVGASQELIEELGRAKKETQFTKAMEEIKTALPQGLLINGRNPLVALHGALSIGLHSESDEQCLQAAHDIRLVLTDLTEKMSLLRQENRELHIAVERLIAKRGGA